LTPTPNHNYSTVGEGRQTATASGADCLVSRSQAPIEPTTAAACNSERRRPPCLSAKALLQSNRFTSNRAPQRIRHPEPVEGSPVSTTRDFSASLEMTLVTQPALSRGRKLQSTNHSGGLQPCGGVGHHTTPRRTTQTASSVGAGVLAVEPLHVETRPTTYSSP
jgi:hypothetical protein